MQWLYQSAKIGKVLITCRYPVPDAADWLEAIAPGPLSAAQTGKLMLRLGALSEQDPESLRLVQRTIGGHPRMLEYLDAILRRGKGARLPDVARRLREQAKKQKIDLQRAAASLEEAIQVAVNVGAGDILLDELLEIAAGGNGDLQALYQSSVFPSPVSLEGLAFCLACRKPAALSEVKAAKETAERLEQLSLVTHVGEEQVWVHRWTAEALRQRMPEESYRSCCRLAGEFLTSRERTTVQSLEATRLFLEAEEYDRAAAEGEGTLGFLGDIRAGGRRGLGGRGAGAEAAGGPRMAILLSRK